MKKRRPKTTLGARRRRSAKKLEQTGLTMKAAAFDRIAAMLSVRGIRGPEDRVPLEVQRTLARVAVLESAICMFARLPRGVVARLGAGIATDFDTPELIAVFELLRPDVVARLAERRPQRGGA